MYEVVFLTSTDVVGYDKMYYEEHYKDTHGIFSVRIFREREKITTKFRAYPYQKKVVAELLEKKKLVICCPYFYKIETRNVMIEMIRRATSGTIFSTVHLNVLNKLQSVYQRVYYELRNEENDNVSTHGIVNMPVMEGGHTNIASRSIICYLTIHGKQEEYCKKALIIPSKFFSLKLTEDQCAIFEQWSMHQSGPIILLLESLNSPIIGQILAKKFEFPIYFETNFMKRNAKPKFPVHDTHLKMVSSGRRSDWDREVHLHEQFAKLMYIFRLSLRECCFVVEDDQKPDRLVSKVIGMKYISFEDLLEISKFGKKYVTRFTTKINSPLTGLPFLSNIRFIRPVGRANHQIVDFAGFSNLERAENFFKQTAPGNPYLDGTCDVGILIHPMILEGLIHRNNSQTQTLPESSDNEFKDFMGNTKKKKKKNNNNIIKKQQQQKSPFQKRIQRERKKKKKKFPSVVTDERFFLSELDPLSIPRPVFGMNAIFDFFGFPIATKGDELVQRQFVAGKIQIRRIKPTHIKLYGNFGDHRQECVITLKNPEKGVGNIEKVVCECRKKKKNNMKKKMIIKEEEDSLGERCVHCCVLCIGLLEYLNDNYDKDEKKMVEEVDSTLLLVPDLIQDNSSQEEEEQQQQEKEPMTPKDQILDEKKSSVEKMRKRRTRTRNNNNKEEEKKKIKTLTEDFFGDEKKEKGSSISGKKRKRDEEFLFDDDEQYKQQKGMKRRKIDLEEQKKKKIMNSSDDDDSDSEEEEGDEVDPTLTMALNTFQLDSALTPTSVVKQKIPQNIVPPPPPPKQKEVKKKKKIEKVLKSILEEEVEVEIGTKYDETADLIRGVLEMGNEDGDNKKKEEKFDDSDSDSDDDGFFFTSNNKKKKQKPKKKKNEKRIIPPPPPPQSKKEKKKVPSHSYFFKDDDEEEDGKKKKKRKRDDDDEEEEEVEIFEKDNGRIKKKRKIDGEFTGKKDEKKGSSVSSTLEDFFRD